jgi:hypothetical protein
MRDYLMDIVQHTYGLGNIDLVKVTGTASDTAIDAIASDRSVILQCKTLAPVAEMVGVFGMPNLGKLNTILNIPEYREDAKLQVKKNKDGDPEGIHFENKAGDFKNDYRFMAAEIVNDKLRSVKFKGTTWGVEIEPSVLSIQRLKFQSQAHSEEAVFSVKTNGTNLEVNFGDHSSHAGDFVFATDIVGKLAKTWQYPIAIVISILGLPGDKSLKLSDDGIMQITVDSGLAVYNYLIPAQTK